MEDLPVVISYHKQKSSTARVRGGKIYLRISNLVSRREQQKHVDELLEKMKRKPFSKKEPIHFRPFLEPLLEESHSVQLPLSTGVCYHLSLKRSPAKIVRVQKIADKLIILQPIHKAFDVEELEEVLWKFFAKDQIPAVEDRLQALKEGWIDESFNTVRLRQVTSRWGSCDKRRGIIMLSVKLLLLDQELFDYVAVHELAHLRHADHSDVFWHLVSKKMPDWKQKRKKLRRFE